MEEEKMVSIDLKTANETVRGLNEAIKVRSEKLKELEIREQNTQDRIHRLEIKKDQDDRVEETKKSVKLIEDRQQLEKDRSSFESGQRAFGIKEAELERRFMDLETREKEIIDIDKAHKELNGERARFNHQKFNMERELEQANITILEAKEESNRLEGIRSELEGKEITIKGKMNILDVERGDVERQKKELRVDIEHLEGLKKWYEENKKEVENVGIEKT